MSTNNKDDDNSDKDSWKLSDIIGIHVVMMMATTTIIMMMVMMMIVVVLLMMIMSFNMILVLFER